MPDINRRAAALLERMGLGGASFVQRITGCPKGWARPNMAELVMVGQGPDLYQVWLGGSPRQDGRTGWAWKEQMKQEQLEETLEPVLALWRDRRAGPGEALGDFAQRVGKAAMNEYVAAKGK